LIKDHNNNDKNILVAAIAQTEKVLGEKEMKGNILIK